MFSYYGSKSKLVDLYPRPIYDTIVEPFAGSARYSLKYWDRNVILVDAYNTITDVWNYLQTASPQDIMALPELSYKESIKDYHLSDGEMKLMSFMVARGVASPQYIVQKFSDIALAKKRIASNLHKIKHWRIVNGDFRCIANVQSTWFIDPPYQYGGEHYRVNKINYPDLAERCHSRVGQVIVCENTKADRMNFRPMKQFSGAYSVTTEAIWSNLPTEYDYQMRALFT